jgi:hypothetical protein
MRIIKDIITLMQEDDWYAISPEMEIAKGKNKLKKTWREKLYGLKRYIMLDLYYFKIKKYK